LVAVHAGPADLGRIYDRLGLFVGMADNFIKPWLIGFGIQMPMLLTILGVFGGFIAFGFLGQQMVELRGGSGQRRYNALGFT
jgi:hypothetical protein